jgi:hypothetical protein
MIPKGSPNSFSVPEKVVTFVNATGSRFPRKQNEINKTNEIKITIPKSMAKNLIGEILFFLRRVFFIIYTLQ